MSDNIISVVEKKETATKRLWWLNDESQQILNRGYLLKGETVKTAIERVATAAAKRLFKPELKESFIELIENGWKNKMDFFN